MTTIKKPFVALYEILEANKDKMPKGVYNSLKAECESKTLAKTFRTNDEGNLEVFCWYHKEWEDTTLIEYGNKKGTKTGLNTFCKQGVSSWTKQQRVFKKAKDEMLDKIANGDIAQDDIAEVIAKLKTESEIIIPLS